MRRIAFVMPSARAGGAERVFVNLLRSLDRRLFEPVCLLVDASGPYLELLPDDVRRVAGGGRRLVRSWPTLLRALRSLRPDLLVSTVPHVNLAALLSKPFLPKRTRVVVRESNVASISLRTDRRAPFFKVFYRGLYPRADAVVAPGQAVKEDLVRWFGVRDERVLVLPNPVDTAAVERQARSGGNPYCQGLNLVSVGSLTVQKGFDLLIKAVAHLVRGRSDLCLTIVGEGPERPRLEERIRSLGLGSIVRLAGMQVNPYPYLFHADLYVLSSRWEGLPNAVLESLACGTPVVGFHCPGCAGEILESPRQGMLVAPGDVKALVRAVDYYARGERPKGRSLLPARFHLETAVARYQEAFLEVMGLG
ncbi:MAG: glycosyltransferase [Deltaproteobacteria bacterium]|nr:MAG: glycosyltransferase [Deltaproteobacteria bacterium]